MTIDYRIAIDRDDRGSFSAAEDISGDALGLRWRLGMRAPHDSMADYGRAVIALRNPNGKYSPERTPLPIGARVRIQSRHKGVSRTHFVGFVSHIDVDGGDQGQKQARLHLQDIQPWLAQSAANLPPQINARADEIIAKLLDSAVLRRRGAGWLPLHRPGWQQRHQQRAHLPGAECGAATGGGTVALCLRRRQLGRAYQRPPSHRRDGSQRTRTLLHQPRRDGGLLEPALLPAAQESGGALPR